MSTSMFADMGNKASKFLADPEVGKAAMIGVEIGLVGALLKLGTSSSTTPEQQAEAQAQADQQKAAAMVEDARVKEAQADEDRRQAYFANQGPTF